MIARRALGTASIWAVLALAPSAVSALPTQHAPALAAAAADGSLSSGAIGGTQASPALSLPGASTAVAQSVLEGGDDEDDEDDDEDDDETENESATASSEAAVVPEAQGSSHPSDRTPASADARAGTLTPSAEDEPDEIGAGAEVDAVTRYVWRGLALSSGPALQPSAWLSCGNVSVELWTNVLLRDEQPLQRLSAIDPSVSYARAFRHFKVEASFTGYWQSEAAQSSRGGAASQPPSSAAASQHSSTAEAELKLSALWGPLRIVTAHAIDIDAEPGAYFGTLGVELRERQGPLGLRVFTEVGWANAPFNRSYWGAGSGAMAALSGPRLDVSRVDRAAFDVAEIGLELRYVVGAGVYVAPHAEGSILLAAALRHASTEPRPFVAGSALGVEF